MTLYLASACGLVALLTVLVRRRLGTDWTSSAHYSLLANFSAQGLLSVALSLFGGILSLDRLSAFLLTLLIGVALCLILQRADWLTTRSTTSPSSMPTYLAPLAICTSYMLATLSGLALFTLDLLPSSMTGDPPRHYTLLFNPLSPVPAQAYKPIYYLWAGIFSALPLPLERDQLFVAFNIFVLGLVTGGVTLLAVKLIRPLPWPNVLFVATLTAFGYPYFALQYGYFTLLLSSAFLFFSLAFLIDYLKSGRRSNYGLGILLFSGVVLTHSYLAPVSFLLIAAFFLYRNYRHLQPLWTGFLWHLPFWLFLVLVTVVSNPFVGNADSTQSLAAIVRVNGFGTGNFFGNVFPFAALSLPFLVQHDKTGRSRALLIALACAGGVSYLLIEISQAFSISPYYVNRSLLALLPLLIIGSAGTLQRIGTRFPSVATIVSLGISLTVAAPYVAIERTPLALAKIRFLALLNQNSDFLYLANPSISAHSPLEFTHRDRQRLKELETACSLSKPEKMAVLGSDHEVFWFGIYTGIVPSLLARDDPYITTESNVTNYEAWKSSTDHRYIAVIKHMTYLVPGKVIADIRNSATLVCQGDSFDIYRK